MTSSNHGNSLSSSNDGDSAPNRQDLQKQNTQAPSSVQTVWPFKEPVSRDRLPIHRLQNGDPHQVKTGVFVTVHGHFYQPPRENPYLDAIERQPSATPCHDWNERVHQECYRPNAFARVLNDRGEVMAIVNNFEHLSFNIGPTLMSWMERHDVEVYQRILEADRLSCDRLEGHGNAIAQVYNHIIMPLANERDKITQVRWGIDDFRTRFQRDPEGMWLAETAVDYATLQVLVDEGIRFIILAPSQAQRCRPLPTPDNATPDWTEVGGGQIDPIQPYRCFMPGGNPNHDYIDIFFYDGPISRDMGFNHVMDSSQHFASRISQAVRGDHRESQLISVATDGETFGHHKAGAEKALAYALTTEFSQQGWTVTNFSHYLSHHSPTWEVELKPVTAWSCSHGVDRWQDNCGCCGGGLWHQKWRRPLRDTLDWLRDQLIPVFEERGCQLFSDPWAARNDYIQVIHHRSPANVQAFLNKHQTHDLSDDERIDALRLLEMQRHSLLMYTSCGWFFDEISRPEGTQILRYAARAIELAGDVAGIQLEEAFIQKLKQAPSNVEHFGHGGRIYSESVIPSKISLEQVAAHYAISSLFTPPTTEQQVYCYTTHQYDYQLQRIGPLTLAMGQLELISTITQENAHLVFAVFHLGGWDFHCCITPFSGRLAYSEAKTKLIEVFNTANIAQTIRVMNQVLGDRSYSLQNLFAEERHRIMHLLSEGTLTRLDQLYSQVYRDNYSVLLSFHREQLTVPQELQVAAEIAIGQRALSLLQGLEQEMGDGHEAGNYSELHHTRMAKLAELDAIATEAQQFNCALRLPQAKAIIEDLILRSLWQLLHAYDPDTAKEEIHWIQALIKVGDRLRLNIHLDRAQELYLQTINRLSLEEILGSKNLQEYSNQELSERLNQLIKFGHTLNISV
ncbi:MAG: DUF3536 domain-containing protein [Cyanobacteria bacterium P01_F01_bin.150]